MGGRAGDGGKNWLLIKHRDEEAKPAAKFDVLKREPKSVLSGRDMDEIASDADARLVQQWQGRAQSQSENVGEQSPLGKHRRPNAQPKRCAMAGRRSRQESLLRWPERARHLSQTSSSRSWPR